MLRVGLHLRQEEGCPHHEEKEGVLTMRYGSQVLNKKPLKTQGNCDIGLFQQARFNGML